eukprot:symbB.v1.2.033638.t1/scaffold4202.1/size44672/4
MGKSLVQGGLKVTKVKTQRELESTILRRCAAGRDRLDRRMAPGVKIVKVNSDKIEDFPTWTRHEGRSKIKRGSAEWYLPPKADPSRRMLFLHGGSYVVYAPCDSVYRSLASRLALQCGLCVLSIDYRLAPEHLFPKAFEDGAKLRSLMSGFQWGANAGTTSLVMSHVILM